ncbi:MAG: hypothetical protein S4CHLAM7_02050 [Chlamydiae bacterium]|nr:hypothetical protein [Chlamydiota bacterium]
MHYCKQKPALIKAQRRAITQTIDAESRRIFQEITANFGTETIPMVGYGSLMNPESAKKTICDENAIESMERVHVLGYERIFNANLKMGGSTRRRDQDGDQDWAVLNMQKSSGRVSMNAVRIHLNLKDFNRVRRREGFYDLIPVVTTKYSADGVEGQPQSSISYSWIVTDPTRLGAELIQPIPMYYRLISESLQSDEVNTKWGPEFFEEYLNTTTLANGTSIRTIHEKIMADTEKDALEKHL